jgi:hypothetical protein
MKKSGEVEVWLQLFFTSVIVLGELLASRLDGFTAVKVTPVPMGQYIVWAPESVQTPWRKVFCPCWEENILPFFPSISLLTIPNAREPQVVDIGLHT